MTVLKQFYEILLNDMQRNIVEIYRDSSGWDLNFLWWYSRMAQYYRQLGIPEDNILEIMKEHRISPGWVKRYGKIHSPEMVAQNILKHRHDKKETYEAEK